MTRLRNTAGKRLKSILSRWGSSRNDAAKLLKILIKSVKQESALGYWRRARFTLALLGLLGIGLGFAYFSAGEIYQYSDTVAGVTEKLPQVDSIVCLAGGRGRIGAAADLWFRYWQLAQEPGSGITKVPVLYLSGMGPQVTWNSVSKQVRRPVLGVIRSTDLLIENESSNTYQNAQYLARYARERQWRKVLLLTSTYHMKRAHFIFNHVLKALESPIEVETLSFYQEPFGSNEWRNGTIGLRVTLFEYLKWVYYRSVWQF